MLYFNPVAEVACNFCIRNFFLPAPIESVGHVFFDCPVVYKIWTLISAMYFTINISRQEFFSCQLGDVEKYNGVCSLLLDIFRYVIWQAKLQKINISVYTVKNEMEDIIKAVQGVSPRVSNLFLNCPFICIDGNRAGGQGGDGDRGGERDRPLDPRRP